MPGQGPVGRAVLTLSVPAGSSSSFVGLRPASSSTCSRWKRAEGCWPRMIARGGRESLGLGPGLRALACRPPSLASPHGRRGAGDFTVTSSSTWPGSPGGLSTSCVALEGAGRAVFLLAGDGSSWEGPRRGDRPEPRPTALMRCEPGRAPLLRWWNLAQGPVRGPGMPRQALGTSFGARGTAAELPSSVEVGPPFHRAP